MNLFWIIWCHLPRRAEENNEEPQLRQLAFGKMFNGAEQLNQYFCKFFVNVTKGMSTPSF